MKSESLPGWMRDGLRRPEPPLEKGTFIGRRYEICAHIGDGGFGSVYKALDHKLERPVALKLMAAGRVRGMSNEGRSRYVETFECEARLTARLPHPNIVVVHDVRIASAIYRDRREIESGFCGTPFLVMELLEGQTLRARIQEAPIGVLKAIELLERITMAVAYAHDGEVIHRDLKPANVFMCTDGNTKVLDFGIALADARANILELHGVSAGTPGYMAPEQRAGNDQDERVDVWALGVMAYEMLTGRLPFDEPGTLPSSVVSVRSHALDVPVALDDLVRRCVAHARTDRPNSAPALLAELRRIRSSIEGGATGPLESTVQSSQAPFPGLTSFAESDAMFFFGRSTEIRDLVGRWMPDRRWLAIEGPSGVGKSSVVEAGVLPAVRHGWLDDTNIDDFRVVRLRPGNDAASAVRLALGHSSDDPIRTALDELEPQQGLLLVVDQLEELFRSTNQHAVETFQRWVEGALANDSRFYLVTTMRSEFVVDLASLTRLGPMLNDVAARYQLPALRGHALRQAVVGPAALTGTVWETGLPERIIADAGHDASALPLVGHLLRTLWEERDGGVITIATYERLGELGGAFAQKSSELFASLGATGRDRAKALLLALVVTGQNHLDTRRTLPRSRALDAAGGDVEAERVLATLTEARLVVEHDGHVDIVHEALLTKWPLLRRWIDDARRELERRDELTTAARTWAAAGRPADGLPRGTQLAYLATASADDDVARAYLDAATHAQNDRRRQTARTFRRRLAVLSVALVAMLALTAWALTQRAEAVAERAASERSRAESITVANKLVHDIDRRLEEIAGTSQVRGELLDTASGLLERLQQDDSDSVELLKSQIRGHRQRAGLAVGYESVVVAAREFDQAESLGRRLMALRPDLIDVRIDLTTTLRRLHWLHRSRLAFALARERSEECLRLLEPIVDADPGDVVARRALVDVYGDLASLTEAVGPLFLAEWSSSQGHDYLAPLIAHPSPAPEDLSRLSRSHRGRWSLLSRTGLHERAAVEFELAVSADERRLVSADELTKKQSRAWYALYGAEHLLSAGALSDVDGFLERASVLIDDVVRARPGQRRLAELAVRIRHTHGDLALRRGDLDAAEVHFDRALADMAELSRADAANPRFSASLGWIHLGRARIRLERHQPFAASDEADLAVRFLRQRWSEPTAVVAGLDLIEGLLTLARAQAMQDDHDSAKNLLAQVAEVRRAIDDAPGYARSAVLADDVFDLAQPYQGVDGWSALTIGGGRSCEEPTRNTVVDPCW